VANSRPPDPGYQRGYPRAGRRHFVGPLILLGAGVLLLLNNLQMVPWSIWHDLWPYWPVLLMLLGLEAFVTGRVAWGTLVMLIVLLPILGLIVSAGSLTSHWREATTASPDRLTTSLQQPLGELKAAAVDVEYGAGALDLAPLPPDLAASTLADASVYGRGTIRFENANQTQPDRGRLRILQRDDDRGMEPGHLDLGRLNVRLSPAVPIDLTVSSGVTDTTLNLETLRVPNLTLETGASQTRIILPAHGETLARIEGGAARIDVTVPPNVAARIIVGDGPNAINIDEARFPRQGQGQGKEYRSAAFETATDRVTLRIDVGATRLVVQ
jgi:hypothetical protein